MTTEPTPTGRSAAAGDDPWLRDALVILVRHGRTELNAAGVLRGHLDPGLDEVGRGEVATTARAVAAHLRSRTVVRVVTSPLRRAVQTAEAVATATGAPVDVDARLIDRDYGLWAGHGAPDVIARFGTLDAADHVEPADAVTARALAVLEAQLPTLVAGPVVLVAHDVVNRLLLAALDPSLGPPDAIGQRTACWNLIVRQGRQWRVVQVDASEAP